VYDDSKRPPCSCARIDATLIAGPSPAHQGEFNVRWVAGIFIAIAIALPGGAQAAPPEKKLLDYYPLTPGTKWTYDVDPGNGRKIRLTNQIARIETIDGKSLARLETIINGRVAMTQHLLSTSEGVLRYRLGEADVSPPLRILKYPFKEGETWQAEQVIGHEQSKMSFKSGRHEELTLTAVKYQAISVECEINMDGARLKNTSWYAPDVGLVRDTRDLGNKTITMDLVTFEAGK
jgi:hypothetical protein